MTPQYSSDLLHRFELRAGAHRTCAPFIEKLPGLIGRGIAPEELIVLLERSELRTGAQIVAQQLRESSLLLLGRLQPEHTAWPLTRGVQYHFQRRGMYHPPLSEPHRRQGI